MRVERYNKDLGEFETWRFLSLVFIAQTFTNLLTKKIISAHSKIHRVFPLKEPQCVTKIMQSNLYFQVPRVDVQILLNCAQDLFRNTTLEKFARDDEFFSVT